MSVPIYDARNSTTASVNSSATNVTLIAARKGRIGAVIHNASTQVLYVKLGATASASDYTYKIAADAHVEVPFYYSGQVDGIWASANGAAKVTEVY
jgi:hypothetical protein